MRVRDRYTGAVLPGEYVLGDDYADAPCPICGAQVGQQCTIEDPPGSGSGAEIGPYIHRERADYDGGDET